MSRSPFPPAPTSAAASRRDSGRTSNIPTLLRAVDQNVDRTRHRTFPLTYRTWHFLPLLGVGLDWIIRRSYRGRNSSFSLSTCAHFQRWARWSTNRQPFARPRRAQAKATQGGRRHRPPAISSRGSWVGSSCMPAASSQRPESVHVKRTYVHLPIGAMPSFPVAECRGTTKKG